MCVCVCVCVYLFKMLKNILDTKFHRLPVTCKSSVIQVLQHFTIVAIYSLVYFFDNITHKLPHSSHKGSNVCLCLIYIKCVTYPSKVLI